MCLSAENREEKTFHHAGRASRAAMWAEHLGAIKLDVKTPGDGGQQAFAAIGLGNERDLLESRMF